MPRFTSQQIGQNVIVTDHSDGLTYTFAASLGPAFFNHLLFDLNIEDHANEERQKTLIEHGVEVG